MTLPGAAQRVQQHAFLVFGLDQDIDLKGDTRSQMPWPAATAQANAAFAAVDDVTRGRRFACAACGKMPDLHSPAFQKCAACLAVTYCGKPCQLAHWPAHRADCKKLRKQATKK
jgi:hypothetical protein